MADEPKITTRKLAVRVPVQLLGLDEQGRQLYRCPTPGCGETAHFDEDGKGHCPVGDAEQEFLTRALEHLERLLPEAPYLGFDPKVFRHMAEVTCSCPDIETTTWGELARGERSSTKGYDHDCRIHGTNGTDPLYRSTP